VAELQRFEDLKFGAIRRPEYDRKLIFKIPRLGGVAITRHHFKCQSNLAMRG